MPKKKSPLGGTNNTSNLPYQTDKDNQNTPLKAIGLYCLGYCMRSKEHNCSTRCPLYQYRLGEEPKDTTKSNVVETNRLDPDNPPIWIV